MYTFDDTLAFCDFILDTLACEHEPTTFWTRIPSDDTTTVWARNAFTVLS